MKRLFAVLLAVMCAGPILAQADSTTLSMPSQETAWVVSGNACIYVNDPTGQVHSNGAKGIDVNTGKLMTCTGGVWKAGGDVPSGTMCGLASAIEGSKMLCQGMNVLSGCPAGYTRTSFAEGNKGGIQVMYYCTKI